MYDLRALPVQILDVHSSFDHHGAELLGLETGTAQHRLHHLVGEQIFEARLIAAAFDAPIHDPLLPVRLYAGSTQSVSALCRSTGNFTAGCNRAGSIWAPAASTQRPMRQRHSGFAARSP